MPGIIAAILKAGEQHRRRVSKTQIQSLPPVFHFNLTKLTHCHDPRAYSFIVCHWRAGKAVPEVVEAILKAGEQHRRRVSTATLNLVLKEATAWKAPPSQRGSMKKGKIYYATQVCLCVISHPPTRRPATVPSPLSLKHCYTCARTHTHTL